jgi:hypothetical protein
MTILRDGSLQLLNVSPAKRFNESILQNQGGESLQQIVSGAYDPSYVPEMLAKTRTEILTSDIQVLRSRGYTRSFPVQILWMLMTI